MGRDRHLSDVRRQLDELRRRIGCRKGDELDHALVAVEGLAITMAAMSTDAAVLIAEGERNVGAVVSAALTKAALWRLVILPAMVAALVSAMIMGVATTVQVVVAQRVIQADHDAWAEKVETDRSARAGQFEELRADLERQRLEVEADRQRLEGTLPSELLKRADTLTGAARDIVRQEAANPDFIDFIARSGLMAFRAAKLNAGSLCPITAYQGVTRYCEFRAE